MVMSVRNSMPATKMLQSTGEVQSVIFVGLILASVLVGVLHTWQKPCSLLSAVSALEARIDKAEKI
jgi:hypothetical protein